MGAQEHVHKPVLCIFFLSTTIELHEYFIALQYLLMQLQRSCHLSLPHLVSLSLVGTILHVQMTIFSNTSIFCILNVMYFLVRCHGIFHDDYFTKNFRLRIPKLQY